MKTAITASRTQWRADAERGSDLIAKVVYTGWRVRRKLESVDVEFAL